MYNFVDHTDADGGTLSKDVESVPDREVSSFDATLDPAYVTVKLGKRRIVQLDAGYRDVARIVSDNPGVAAKLIPSDDRLHTVQITGSQMGTANLRAVVDHPDPKWRAVADIIVGQLEVDVCGPMVSYLNFHFVTDSQGRPTSRNAASVKADIFPELQRIYGASNIEFQFHNSRTIEVKDLDFTTMNQSADQVTAIFDALQQRSKEFDGASAHLNVWCVKEWAARDVISAEKTWDEVGRARGNVIIIEDKPSRAGPGAVLAHEVGHCFGLPHNNTVKSALMNEHEAGYAGTKLFKAEYRKLIRLK
jgi:hypothetical protein